MSVRRVAHTDVATIRGARAVAGALALALLSVGASGCYTQEMTSLRTGLDSLRMQIDRITLRDSVSARTLDDTRHELADQKDLLLATRATASSTSRETGETLGRLEGKLDDIMTRFRIANERQSSRNAAQPPASPPVSTGTTGSTGTTANTGTGQPTSTPGTSGPLAGIDSVVPSGPPAAANPQGPATPDPTQLYDQATEDLTQGRYGLALVNYREYLRRYPETDLADNAQYGAGECYFAQAQFDSALVEYARVGTRWPQGDRAPAALYKLGLCQERLGRMPDSRKTFDDLVKRFPQSGESQLARDRLATKH